jgi:GNAT superfamily N-acetyltransferase
MYRTSIASDADRGEILRLLEARGLVENWSVIVDVATAPPAREDGCDRVVLCRAGERIAGVAGIRSNAGTKRNEDDPDYYVSMEATEGGAVAALVEALPTGELGYFDLYRPIVQEHLDGLPGLIRWECDLYFTASAERFRPVAGEEVIEVTAADAYLFEGCEHPPLWENMGEESRRFAILRDGRVAASTGFAPMTPRGATSRRAVAISGLRTQTPHRRQGLGRRLVSHLTEMILREGNVPMYWTEPDNVASRRLCESLGYWQCAQNVRYKWRRPGR